MKRLLSSIFGILLLAGTALAQDVVDEIVVRVNDDIILKSEVEEQQALVRESLTERLQGAQLERAIAEAEKDLIRNMIDQKLLLQKAAEFDITADLEVIRTMERMRQEYDFPTLEALGAAIIDQGQSVEDFKNTIADRYLTQQVLQREVYGRIIITTEEMRNYYEANKTDFDRPEGVQIREIVLETEGKTPEEADAVRQRAEEALARIRGGEDFAAVAAEVSEAPTAAAGGDLGFFEQGSLSADYARISADLGRNQTSDIVELSDALVILQVRDRHRGGILPFELAQQEIQEILWSQRVESYVRDYLSRLRLEGFVEVRGGYADSGAAETASSVDSSPETASP